MFENIKKILITRRTGILAGGLVLVMLLGFVEKKHDNRSCQRIVINIDHQHDNYFIHEDDVLRLLTENNVDKIIGKKYKDIDLKALEKQVKSHNFVQDAQAFKNHKGSLMVEVRQARPIARVIQANGPNVYIGNNGNILPSSDRFTARVMIIDGEYSGEMLNENYLITEGSDYLEFIEYISSDPFWKAQIAQITIDRKGNMFFYPQVGDQIIEFGKPLDYRNKLERVKIFFEKIMPFKGYNYYDSVSVKYKDQIICQ